MLPYRRLRRTRGISNTAPPLQFDRWWVQQLCAMPITLFFTYQKQWKSYRPLCYSLLSTDVLSWSAELQVTEALWCGGITKGTQPWNGAQRAWLVMREIHYSAIWMALLICWVARSYAKVSDQSGHVYTVTQFTLGYTEIRAWTRNISVELGW